MSDIIRREDAIKKIVELNMQVYEGGTNVGIRTCLTKEEIIYAIDDIPSAELERKNGKWIECDDDSTTHGYCSICGWESKYYEDDVVGMPYCPLCGAEMSGE